MGSQSILRADCQIETPIVRYSNYRFIDLPPDTCNETEQKWHMDISLHGMDIFCFLIFLKTIDSV